MRKMAKDEDEEVTGEGAAAMKASGRTGGHVR